VRQGSAVEELSKPETCPECGLESRKYQGILTSIKRLGILGSEGCQLANPIAFSPGGNWLFDESDGVLGNDDSGDGRGDDDCDTELLCAASVRYWEAIRGRHAWCGVSVAQ
jgi:hypothetical protein